MYLTRLWQEMVINVDHCVFTMHDLVRQCQRPSGLKFGSLCSHLAAYLYFFFLTTHSYCLIHFHLQRTNILQITGGHFPIKYLTLCMLGNFACFFVVCGFLLNQLFQKNLSVIPSVSNSLNPDQARHFVGPLGPNCLQRLSADAKSRHQRGKSCPEEPQSLEPTSDTKRKSQQVHRSR